MSSSVQGLHKPRTLLDNDPPDHTRYRRLVSRAFTPKKMAELRLVPAVNALPPDAVIAAAGTSCRAQIRDLTGRQPLHPAEIMLRALQHGLSPSS